MSGGSSVEQHIDAVDAFARTLYVRTRESPAVADAVRQLHIALRHLRVEAADPDSPLSGGAYTSQIRPLVDDCGATLRQLEHVLDDGRRGEQMAGSVRRLRDRIDGFLDAVQLQARATTATVDQDQTGLEGIKDKVDDVAKRVFAHRDSGLSDQDSLWLEFKTELENEGFSPEVLRRHKEVLRAYIRELESMSSQNGGVPPTVRGLLEYEAEAENTPSPKEMYPSIENEKFAPSMKMERRMPEEGPPPIPPKEALPERPTTSQRRQSSSSDGSPRLDGSDSTALILTRDLVAMDSLSTGMANMQMVPRGNQQQYGASPASPSQKYLPYAPSMAGPQDLAELPGSPTSQLLGSSPRFAPLPTYSSLSSPPPTYGTSPRRSTFRLAPDRYGQEIPMDAQWTRINRDRVSPEVLERAGVRYEARPTYVAVLGRLSREQIEDYARQSADCRAARQLRQAEFHRQNSRTHERADSKSSRDDEDDDSDLWDSSDSTDYDDDKTSEKGTKSYLYIVSPPGKEKGSPASTVPPKSILKNKNENHVRFDPEPHEVDTKSPRSSSAKDRERDHRRRQHRDERYYGDRERHGNDRDRERDRHSRRHHDDKDKSRRRDYHERPDRGDKPDRRSKKKAWGEAIGAVGLGGAAVSLLSVLAEAASAV